MLNDLIQGLSGLFSSYPTDERRSNIRVPYRAAVYCLSGKKVIEPTVSNIGPKGLCLQSVKRLSRGQSIYLIYRGAPGSKLSRFPHKTLHTIESKLACKVLWCQKKTDAFEVGVRFAAEGEAFEKTWAKIILDKLVSERGALAERRFHVRARASVNAELKCQGESIIGLLTNVGLGGAMFQSTKHLAAGQSVNLTVKAQSSLPALRLDGEILSHSFDVVSNSGLHNIRFKALDQASADLLRRYLLFFLKANGS